MNFLKLPHGARFSNRHIMFFLLPILFEQLMVAGLNMADTFMVSFLGEASVAGVALVSRIDNFVKCFLVALAQGGSVVMSQYLGAENKKRASLSLKNNIFFVVFIGILIMLVMVLFRPWVLQVLFGSADAEVLKISNTYFTITAFSYPFVALYYADSASYRAMGESKIPSLASIAMMGINLILKYLFIFKLNMGVKGAALSTLIAMAVVGFSLLIMLRDKHNAVSLERIFSHDFDKDNLRRILNVSIPNGIEQGMFQLGALAIAGLVSSLGTAAIAADSIARTLSALVHSMGAAFAAVMMMLIGNCMGAGKPDEAQFYTRHILKLNYILTFINVLLFLIFLKPMIMLFDISLEAQNYAFWILILYCAGSITFYPTSFATAAALRGTGDTKFVMLVATASMFIFRIGAAYILVHIFKMGIIGTWVAMVSDWVIRSAIFMIRFKHGKWMENKVI